MLSQTTSALTLPEGLLPEGSFVMTANHKALVEHRPSPEIWDSNAQMFVTCMTGICMWFNSLLGHYLLYNRNFCDTLLL